MKFFIKIYLNSQSKFFTKILIFLGIKKLHLNKKILKYAIWCKKI